MSSATKTTLGALRGETESAEMIVTFLCVFKEVAQEEYDVASIAAQQEQIRHRVGSHPTIVTKQQSTVDEGRHSAAPVCVMPHWRLWIGGQGKKTRRPLYLFLPRLPGKRGSIWTTGSIPLLDKRRTWAGQHFKTTVPNEGSQDGQMRPRLLA